MLLKLLGTVSLSILCIGPWGVSASAESDSDDGVEILDHYLNATQVQQNTLRGMAMEVDIDATAPKWKKQGTLHALRKISKLGRITYKALGFTGDDDIKKQVIARYLEAEQQAQESPKIAITPANYKFKYKGIREADGRRIYLFQLHERKKVVGAFRGELWLDVKTYLPVRESGRLVKNPSIFFKKVDFVREYQIIDGAAYPTRMESSVDTRIVGRIDFSINYSHFVRDETDEISGLPVRDTQ